MGLVPKKQVQFDVALPVEQALERLRAATGPVPTRTRIGYSRPTTPLVGELRPDGFTVYRATWSGAAATYLAAKATPHEGGTRITGEASLGGVGALVVLMSFVMAAMGTLAVVATRELFMLPMMLGPLLPIGIVWMSVWGDSTAEQVRRVIEG